MDVASHGAIDDLAQDCALLARSFQLGFQDGHGRLHGFGRLHEIGQKHLSTAEFFAEIVQTFDEPFIDGIQRIDTTVDRLLGQTAGIVDFAVDNTLGHRFIHLLTHPKPPKL
jgi:hypothetical protein